MNILIIDDHPLMRRGVRQILEESFPGCAVQDESTCENALIEVRVKAWDLIILDISLPAMGGLEFLDRVRRIKPDLPVLILTLHSESQFAVHAVRSGARGYVTKLSATDELVGAVRRVLDGGHWVSHNFAEQLLFGSNSRALNGAQHHTLSPRELRVMTSIASGYSVTEIAAQLCLSVKTVSTYRSRLLEKLGLSSNAELTRYCLDHKLVM